MALVRFEDGEAQVLWRAYTMIGTAEHKLVLVTVGLGSRSLMRVL